MMSKKNKTKMPGGWEIIGNRDKALAIIDTSEDMDEKAVAENLMKTNKSVRSVLKKVSERKGVYRKRAYKVIGGDKNTEVIHLEHGCRYFLDPQKVYFSSRESTERLRVASQVKNNETVMVFFAGIGALPITISKHSKPSHVIGIEINPVAIKYFKKNVVLNKLSNIVIVKGDVKKLAKQFYGQCDRVLMPLPESAKDYIDEAVKCLKRNGIIQVYLFAPISTSASESNKNFDEEIKMIETNTKSRLKFKCSQRVLPYAPYVYKWRVDFLLSKK